MEFGRIHILGASGSGTTTLGNSLAQRRQFPHWDGDDFLWLPTDPPFQTLRPKDARLNMLTQSLAMSQSWILSGSICGWGDAIMHQFDLVIFLSLPADVRIRRLRAREAQRFGAAAVAPGGSMHRQHDEFIQWAAAYDDGDLNIRSRRLHEKWMVKLACPILRLDGEMPTESQLELIDRFCWK
jgi:adenylate kinase family enzyme